MKRNPCFKSKDDQCANRHVGCRNTCLHVAKYESEKHEEYEQRRKDAIALPNTVKAEFKTEYLRWKAGH